MRYALATWAVRDLLLIPSFMFSESAVIKRPPLSPTARRAGWVGCNLDLHRIAPEARIFIVRTIAPQSSAAVTAASHPDSSPGRRDACATLIATPEEVREKFKRVKPLKDISVTQRGWTLDVLNIVRRLVDSRRRGDESGSAGGKGTRLLTSSPTGTFTTADVYAFTRELEKLHPDNRHVRDKIRQQLQVLRDAGLLLHIGRNCWRLP